MEQKSNKTDHVLNLLSGVKKKDKKTVTTDPVQEQEQKPIEDVSDLIQKELEKELENLPVQENKPEDLVEDITKIEIAEKSTDTIETQVQNSHIEKNEEPIQVDVTENLKRDEYEFINVMEHVVSVHAKEYMDKFNTCSCSRCRADVIAYSLTHLPSKYIVINVEEKIPLMSFYEKKYASQMRVELIKACMIVKENPHHK